MDIIILIVRGIRKHMRAERELRGRNELGPCTDLTTSLDGPIQKKNLLKGGPKGQSNLNHILVIFIAYTTIHLALYVMWHVPPTRVSITI